MWYDYGYRPYVSVAERRANAAREIAKLMKKGQKAAPVCIEGRTIAQTFWGKAWCENLEAYSDFANRLPRGRTYVRNGSVVHLQIEPAKITALVSGSNLYKIQIAIEPVAKAQWEDIRRRCAGQIGSLVELLQGRLSKGVMDIVTARPGGLFPKPAEIDMKCSCPDWAGMCKHLAAVMYGVGARLDRQPELLFQLRKVDHLQLIEEVAVPTGGKKKAVNVLVDTDIADVFGIDMAPEPEVAKPKKRARATAKKAAPKGKRRAAAK